jgi:membrane protease subunit HflK
MYLDMMSQVMGNISKVMVDQKNGNSLLYLPLDKLIESSRTTGTAVDVPAAPKSDAAPVTSQGNDNNAAQRARDSLLSRDREARP